MSIDSKPEPETTKAETKADIFNNGAPHTKSNAEYIERFTPTGTHATYIEEHDIATLSQEHRDYLLRRHGTLNLDPLPGPGDADPYNWTNWKVRYQLPRSVSEAILMCSVISLESCKPYPRCFSCLHVHFHSRFNYPSISGYCKGP